MTVTANWSYPTNIRFGAGRIAELPDACRMAGIKHPLVVTDKGLAEAPMTGNMLDLLTAAGFDPVLFSNVDSNPNEHSLDAGIAAFWRNDRDGVIAFGGGSAMDLGKLVAFMAGQVRPVWDFEDKNDWWKRAEPSAIVPIVAVPTTAGTGSEVGRTGVLVNSETKVKTVIFHPRMLPSVVIADAELTVGMPRELTVGTGMDAFAHNLEAYCASSYHPMSHGIALEGMRLVKENLPRVVADGGDIVARGNMMSAAAMGAVAFQKGLGAIHALSHPVGAIYDTHHGMTNAVLIPAVLSFNRPVVEDRIAAAAGYLGLSGGFDGFYDFIVQLRDELGVPKTLGAFGVDESRIDELAEMALADPNARGNPCTLHLDNIKELLRSLI